MPRFRLSTSGEDLAIASASQHTYIFLGKGCKLFIRLSKMPLTTPPKVRTPGLFQTFLSTNIFSQLCTKLIGFFPPYSPRDLPFGVTIRPGSIFLQRRLWPPFPQTYPVPLNQTKCHPLEISVDWKCQVAEMSSSLCNWKKLNALRSL